MRKYGSATCLILGFFSALTACDRATSPNLDEALSGPQLVASLAELSQAESQPPDSSTKPPEAIRRFCGDCHALPLANRYERDVWYSRIRLGYEYYVTSGRTDLVPPPFETVLRYYRDNAPAKIVFPDPPAVDTDWVARFAITKMDWKDAGYITPAVSSIRWLDLMAPGESHLIVTDMRDGSVSLVNPDPQHHMRKVLCRTGNPAGVTPCDFDLDGLPDLVVSDLGSSRPFDHQLGKVVLLRRLPESAEFEQIVLLEGVGRVADVAVGNFAGDKKPDLIVGEFGSRYTGGIRLLVNRSESVRNPVFASRVLDSRPGTVGLPAHDWNEDGDLDFAALISQEHESIELFINHRDRFDMHTLFLGPDLSYGSSGIEAVDLDQDGDQDILFTNGDSLDNNYANLSHGVGWLENTGQLRFEHHRLVDLPGAFRALASDMDGDGDLDIVVTAYLPGQIKPIALRHSRPVAILLLEQTESLQFVRHVLERGTPRYPALEVADFNHDGKMDFAVGALSIGGEIPGSPASQLPRLTVWSSR